MAFKRAVLWCEFPQKVDWKILDKILKELNYKPEIYVACTSFENYKWWAKEIQKSCKNIREINAWPVLTKEEGYWFSGFTSRQCIDRLLEYKNTKLKIDLEPPLPRSRYSNMTIIRYFLKMLLRKAKNRQYLTHTIRSVSERNEALINEFPLPKFILKNWGCYYPTKNKNVMCYTSLLKSRWLLRLWNFHIAKRRASMCSVGLVHSGIFGNEPYYKDVKELVADMRYAQKQGFENIAVYSIDSIMRRENPSAWLSALNSFLEKV